MLNKIANRFLLGYSVPLIFLIIQGLVTASTIQKVIDLDNQVFQLQAANKELEELTYDISKFLRTARGYALFPKDQTYKNSFDTAYEYYNKNVQQLRAAVIIPNQEQLTNSLTAQANTLITEGNQLHNNFQEVFRLIDANNLAQATQQLSNNRAQTIDTMRK